MVRKPTEKIAADALIAEQFVEGLIKTYQEEYAEYGMDDISNDLIAIACGLKQVALKLKFAMVKEVNDY